MKINTVCLCGSSRFSTDYAEANVELTKHGFSVITVSMVLPSEEAGSGLKELLDLVHLNKILRADAIVVVGDGYVGRSTAREILWASMQHKPVYMAHEYSSCWEHVARCMWAGDHRTAPLAAARSVLGIED